MMKRLHINARFNQAPVPRARQSATIQANTIPLGIKKAVQELLKRHGIKGRRHKAFSLEVIITEVTEIHATPDHDSTTE
ncbi:MAG: hypothetical protein P0119_13300 [Nitrospira sp.]|nr:hypothetical protein [Nitrospira sp.]